MAFRNKRRELPPDPNAPQHIDLGEERARRQREQPTVVVPQTPPVLSSVLPALNPRAPLGARLPPVELAKEYDVELAELLDEVRAASSRAVNAALDAPNWSRNSLGLAQKVEAAPTEAEMVDLWVFGEARAVAAAVLAKRAVRVAEQAVRDYARSARELRRILDESADDIARQIADLFNRSARESGGRMRWHEEAVELAAVWRDVVALLRWVDDSSKPFTPLNRLKIPGSALAAYNASCDAHSLESNLREGGFEDGKPVRR